MPEERSMLNVRIPSQLKKRLLHHCIEKDMQVQDVVKMILENYLNLIDDAAEEVAHR